MPDVDQPTLLRLLDLQAEDSAIKRLQEQRESLPEAARLSGLKDQLAELVSDIEIAAKHDAEAARQQHRLEGEIELIDQKMTKEEQRMLSGNVSNPKELAALQAEVESLKRRKSGLEDQLIDAMEQKEHTGETLERLESEARTISAEASEMDGTVSGLMADIDAELATHTGERGRVAPDIPEDLMKLYDRLRASKSGVGAAALQQGTCQGCHTKIPQKELERIRAEGGLQRCENCRRILVTV